MRRILAIAMSAIMLAGCAGGSLSPPAVTAVTDVAAAVPGVQSEAQNLCQWTPLADDVTVLIGVLFPQGAPVAAMVDGAAKAICAQVSASKAKLRGGPPSAVMVRGVRVRHNTAQGLAVAPLPASVMVNGILVHRQ